MKRKDLTKMRRKFHFSFDSGEVMGWRYCPVCGSELLEIYPGEYVGHFNCSNDECNDNHVIGFRIELEDVEIDEN